MIEKKIEEETVAETKIEEKRVRPTVIRRRRQVPISGPKLEVRSESAEVEADKAAEELEATIVEDKVEVKVKVKEVEKVAEEIDKQTVAVLAVKEDAPKVKEKVKKQDKKSTVEPVAPTKIIQEKKKGKAPLDSVKEVIVFPNDKTDKKKTSHKKKVFSKEQLYFAKERRRGRVSKLPKRELKKTEITVTKASKRVVKVADTISVVDLSQRLGVKASDIIKKLISLGVMATINQFIDLDAATLIANDFGFDVENVAVQEDVLVEGDLNEEPENLEPRPPVVTVMGHVDHGKTLLLDTIRTTNVIGGEHGGITQHIGAYHVHLEKGDITFIDTPGHEAFTSMRARGVKVTDIVILVVAADDGVMPQTIEAINHAKAAEVPIIVAINKIDLPNADVDKVRTELTQYGLVSEEWGGENIFVEVSAKSGLHVKELLELVLLQSEVLELKANPSRLGRGVVLEAKLDKGRGVVATALVQDGSLKVGDVIVSGVYCGRIRAMLDAQGKRVEKAGPSIPVEILGLSGVPDAGDLFSIVKDEAIAKQIANIRSQKRQEKELGKTAKVTLDDLYSRIKEGEMKELGVVIKGDVHGSVEAVKDVLSKLSTEAIKLNIIHGAVGGITEGDVMLASASSAIIIGFNVRPEPKVNSLAEKEGVDIRLYNIIYDVVEDVKKAMEGLLAPIIKETVLGRVEVRQLFKVSKVGTVAGSYVIDGKILRSAMVRLVREDAVIYQGKIASLKRLKESIKEVNAGFECGVAIEGYNDIKVGDIIEAYMIEEEAAKL